eukprot:GEMP01076095.1.p1 GENE.GEMP01076095.1~~GEMP01076095.1.p1  ORF type:complete len:166 (+),score=36.49 GEMP01076095.1:24-521(+)
MEQGDVAYYAGVSDAVAKAIPKLWAAKAKAYAAAKAAMPIGPPEPRQTMQECIDQMNGRRSHRAILDRATGAPAKAKAVAKAKAKAVAALQGDAVIDVISRVEHLTKACYKATFPLRTSLKRQRDGEPIVKSDAAKNVADAATALNNFDAAVDGILEDFMNRSNL